METKTATSRKQMGTQKEKVKKVAGNLSASYNRYKKFGDKQYTGMQIGRGHHWRRDCRQSPLWSTRAEEQNQGLCLRVRHAG